MPLDLRPHQYKKRPNSNVGVLTNLNPYVRMSMENEAPVFIQQGRMYGAGGGEIKVVPPWVREAIDKLSPTVRKEVGADALLTVKK